MKVNTVETTVGKLADVIAKSNAIIHQAAPDYGLIVNFDLDSEDDRRNMQRMINHMHAHALLTSRLADELAGLLATCAETAQENGAAIGADRLAAVTAAAVLARLTVLQGSAAEGGLAMVREEFVSACNAPEVE